MSISYIYLYIGIQVIPLILQYVSLDCKILFTYIFMTLSFVDYLEHIRLYQVFSDCILSFNILKAGMFLYKGIYQIGDSSRYYLKLEYDRPYTESERKLCKNI